MPAIHRGSLVLGGTFFLIAVAALGPRLAGADPDKQKEVLVTNDSSQPVPTAAQGTTMVAGSVGIDPESNTVGIDSGANMVEVAAPQPFQAIFSAGFGTSPGAVDKIPVPAGKRLVIEYVSAEIQRGASDSVPRFLRVCTTGGAGDGQACHDAVIQEQTPGFWVVGQEVRLYADPGTEVFVVVFREGSNPGGGFEGAISGYLTDV